MGDEMSRLFDQKVDGVYPFQYRDASQTDVAATFRRVAGPNWNKPRSKAPKSGQVVTKIGRSSGK